MLWAFGTGGRRSARGQGGHDGVDSIGGFPVVAGFSHVVEAFMVVEDEGAALGGEVEHVPSCCFSFDGIDGGVGD